MTYFNRLLRRFLLRVAILVLAAAAGAAVILAWAPAISSVTPPDRASFATAAIARGATLAALGDCAVCHTAPDGRPYAGGRGVPTPFGTVFATNITPDPATGIGDWSLAAFQRAMRDGIDRQGRHLYPVLPYPHFTRATDDDIAAMYAFLMTRGPVPQVTPGNKLAFPFNYRPLIAGWNLLFLSPGQWTPDASKGAEWNRGAYLVDAIGHCGACHTPHNKLGAEENTLSLAGGEAEGWYAPSLLVATPQPWSVDALTTYLRTGLDKGHGVAAGPMAPVTHQLATVPDADVHAIAVYIASLMPPAPAAATPPPQPHPVADPSATAMFDGACGACHAADAPMSRGGAPSLALSSAVNAPTARNVVDLILHGLPWREGRPGPYMPAFSGALTDAQVSALAAYVRARYSNQPAWSNVDATVREAKRRGRLMMKLTVNGREHAVDAEPDTPLLYVLRDDLGLNGAKFGCGLGQCGACTVIVDGAAVFSCLTPIALLSGRQVTTIEGLGTAEEPGPVQRAFLTEQAAQCGYCIAGMVMRAQALLARTPNPSEQQIRDGLNPNLCRCGTHMRILAAVRRAAGSMPTTRADAQ